MVKNKLIQQVDLLRKAVQAEFEYMKEESVAESLIDPKLVLAREHADKMWLEFSEYSLKHMKVKDWHLKEVMDDIKENK